MNSAFRAVKGDDGILSYTGSTFPIAKGKYREFNKIFYRSKQVITGGTFNAAFWDIIGVTSGSSVSIGLITTGGLTGSTVGSNINVGLGNSGVAAGTYFYPQVTIDIKGRISSATSRTAFSGFTGTAGITGATSGAGSGKLLTVGLGNTSVTPGTYHRASIIVDSKGRITTASGNTLAGANGIGVTGNTISLNATGVAAGTYQLATITVDNRGRISFASGNTAGASTAVGPNTAVQFKNGSVFSGTSNLTWVQNGILTISTASNTGQFHILSGNINFGTTNTVSGSATHSIVFGTGNTATSTSTASLVAGGQNTNSSRYSTAIGRSNNIQSNSHGSVAFGSGNSINSGVLSAMAFGRGNTVSGVNGTAFGFTNTVSGNYGFVLGYRNTASGIGSFAGGYNDATSGARPNIASGLSSFAFSYTDNSQTSGHGALAAYSAILGGRNNNIATSNTGATIIGGNTVKLNTAGYAYHAVVSNLAINDTPTTGTVEDVLMWNSTSKKVLKINQNDLQPIYSFTAFVSKNGNDSTAIVGNARRTFLTVQAAITAVSPLVTSNNRVLVVVYPGTYVETAVLANGVDIELKGALIRTVQENTSNLVEAKIFGNGTIGNISSGGLSITNTNTSSRFSIECDVIAAGLNMRNTHVQVKKIDIGSNSVIMLGDFGYLNAQYINGGINPQGNGEYHVTCHKHIFTNGAEPLRQGAITFNVSSSYSKLYYTSHITSGITNSAIVINAQAGGFSGETYIKGNFYSNNGLGVFNITSISGGAQIRGKMVFDNCYFKNLGTLGASPAVNLHINPSGTAMKYVFKNCQFLSSLGGDSIGNVGGSTIDVRFYGTNLATTAAEGTINALVGALTVDTNIV
jgi:hypothetical protein